MKRNFLLTLLLTLLPFVGWAQERVWVELDPEERTLSEAQEDGFPEVKVYYSDGNEVVYLEQTDFSFAWYEGDEATGNPIDLNDFDKETDFDEGSYTVKVTLIGDAAAEYSFEEDGDDEATFTVTQNQTTIVGVSLSNENPTLNELEAEGWPVVTVGDGYEELIESVDYTTAWYKGNPIDDELDEPIDPADYINNCDVMDQFFVEVTLINDAYAFHQGTGNNIASFTVAEEDFVQGDAGYDDISVSLSKTQYYPSENVKTAVLNNLQVTGVPGSWDGDNFMPTDPNADPISLNQEDFTKKWYVWNSAEAEWSELGDNEAIAEQGYYKVELISLNEYWKINEAANSYEFEVLAPLFKGLAFTTDTDEWDDEEVVGTSERAFEVTISDANNKLTPWYISGEPEVDPVDVKENTAWFIWDTEAQDWVAYEETEFVVGKYQAIYAGTDAESDEDDITATFEVIANPLVEVMVYPTNTQTLVYGTPVEDLKVTPLFFSITEDAFLTDAGRQQIADVLIFKNAEALSTANVGTAHYTLNLNKESELFNEETGKLIITKDGTDYNIVPIGMQGDVDILKGQNELILDNDMPLITVKTDLKYNAAAQVLVNVPTEGEGAEAKPAKVATLGGVQYFWKQKKDYDAAFAPQDPEAEHQTGLIIDPDRYDITSDEGVLGKITWTDLLPTGTEVDDYYGWVRAAGDGTNYDPSEPVYIGAAKINPGVPTLEGTIAGVAETYYLKTTEGNNWKHIYTTNEGAAIVPTINGKLIAKIGGVEKEVPADKISFRINEATYNGDGTVKKDEEGKTIWRTRQGEPLVYNVWTGTLFSNFKVGTYRVLVRVEALDNFSEAFLATEPAVEFEVVKPSYQIVTTSNPTPATIPYDNQASVTFGYRVDHTGYAPEFENAPNAENQSNYTWYTSDGSQAEKTNGKYAAGEYDVVIKDDLFTASEDFVKEETVAAPVSILAGVIMAKIEDQELVYGQTLPLYLTFDSGSGIAPTDTRAINEFNNTVRRNGFTATLIKDAEGKDVADAEPIALEGHGRGRNYWTDLLPVGTWKVSGDFGGDATNRIIASSATRTVTPKDIANGDFDDPLVDGMRNYQLRLHKTYTSNPIELTAEDLYGKFTYRRTTLELGKDFEVSDYANNVNAGTATFTITGKGNFTGTRENRRFTIDKAKIYVRPAADQEWAIGTPVVDENGKSIFTVDWDSPEVVEGEGEEAVVTDRGGIYAQLEYFQQDRKKKKDMAVEKGFKDLAARIAVPSNVDFYPNGLIAYLPEDAEEADNYEFVFEYGALTMNKGLIKIQLADQETDYNFDEPQITKKFELVNGDDLNPILAENWDKVIVKDLDKVTLNKVNWDSKKQEVKEGNNSYWRYPAGAYEFTATDEGAFTSTNYRIEVVEDHIATLTVNPAEITVKAESPEVSFQAFMKDGRFDQAKKNAYIAGITAVNSSNVTITDGPLGHDKYTDIVASLTVNDDNEIVVALADNDNYTVTNQDAMNGTLTIKPLDGIELTSAPAEYKKDPRYPDELDEDENGNPILIGGDWKKITDRDNMPVEYVTLKLKAATLDPANEAYSQWKAGEWHAMVLPFAITVGDVASQFGYAIINVVDVDATNAATKPNEVHFKLQEIMDEIPANTPFLIKSQFDFDYNTTLKFGNINGALKATYPIIIEANDKPSVDAGKTYTFEGTYEPMVIDKNTPTYKFLGPDNRWKQFNESSVSKYTMQPYTGYVNLQGLTGTREIICFFEEEDGTTTAINAAELQNMMKTEGLYRIDGIKVQGAPTQKGVYIQDGKKFVK